MPKRRSDLVYRTALEMALKRIQEFDPAFLIIAFGLDTAKRDPTGIAGHRQS